MSTLHIKNLLSSVSTDSRGAFERFYNLYYDQVFRFAYYCLGDKEACREVVTDVFFSVWQSREKLQDVSNINTYLYIAVRNAAFHYQEKNHRFSNLSLEDVPLLAESGSGESPEDQLETKEMREILNRAIDELPEKCRLIFLMQREEGLKTKEVAEILSIQESTVRVQMKIAVEKLIARLKPDFPNISFSLFLMLLF